MLSKAIRNIFDRNFGEIFTSQLVSISGGLIAGTLLAIYTDKVLLIPGMFILLPGFLEMRGNISGSMSARLSSGLYLGVIKAKKPAPHIIIGNIIASYLLALMVSLFLGLLTFLINQVIFKLFTPEIILIALLAGAFANLIEIPLTLYATLYLYRKGHDPNNIMGPFVTSTGDIISILSLMLALIII